MPAEFIVPTDLPSDIVIGVTYETELMHAETPIGLRFDDLPAGVLTVGTQEARRLTNKRLALQASRHAFAYLIATADPSYRELAEHTPECQIYQLGANLRINPLDPEGLQVDAYAGLLAEALRPFALSDRQWLLLQRLFGNVYAFRHPPTLVDLLEEVRAFLARAEFTDYSDRRDAQFLERLVSALSTGPAGGCFAGPSQPSFRHLLNPGITIIETPPLERHVHSFLAQLILAKTCAVRDPQVPGSLLAPLILLLDDADLHLMSTPGIRQEPPEAVTSLRYWQRRLASVDVALQLSLNHPGLLPVGIVGQFGTIIAHRLTLKEDLDAVQVPLRLSEARTSPYSAKRESLHHRELLQQLDANLALMTRPDLHTAIPIQIPPLPPSRVGVQSEAVKQLPPSLLPVFPPAPTMLHKDFPTHVEEAAHLLSLLREYSLTPTALATTAHYSDQLVASVLETLVAHRYVHSVEEGSARHRRMVFTITPKGEAALAEYARHELSLQPTVSSAP